ERHSEGNGCGRSRVTDNLLQRASTPKATLGADLPGAVAPDRYPVSESDGCRTSGGRKGGAAVREGDVSRTVVYRRSGAVGGDTHVSPTVVHRVGGVAAPTGDAIARVRRAVVDCGCGVVVREP